MGEEGPEIRVKTAFAGKILVMYILPDINLDQLKDEMRDKCKFGMGEEFTMKWIDDEGDPCLLSSQAELNEALKLYEMNRDPEITIHVFQSVPSAPGQLCPGEDKSVYRRGARRWRKLYLVNGHTFQPKRFSRKAFCAFCHDRIWGLGRQGFKCTDCKLMVHKKCHKTIQVSCQGYHEPSAGRFSPSSSGPSSHDNNHHNDHHHHAAASSSSAKMNGDKTGLVASGGQLKRRQTPRRSKDRLSGHRPQLSPSASVNHDDSMASGQLVGSKSLHDALTEDDDEDNGATGAKQYSLNDFDLLRVIGRGSYAKVLMVELKKTKRIYAMKVIKKELVTDDEDIDWVQTEKHVFETASNYPFLVGLHSCFQTPSRLFFVIEFVKGGDLMFHMQRQRKLPEEHARFYSAEITLALNFLHERGIIYRDLKLDNVLLDHEGHIKLTDYGMCKEGINRGDTTSTFCGTPNYIAPEILRGEDYDFSVDYWALGVLMYEMLAGRSPFDIMCNADNPDQNTEDYLFQYILEKTIRIPRSISVKAQSVLKGFLNKNPHERLGCSPDGNGFLHIQSHLFFKQIDWVALEQKQLVPPYKPKIENERDLEHFDPQFTNEPVQLTPDDPKSIEKIDQSEFDGFEYVNPLLMSLEDCV